MIKFSLQTARSLCTLRRLDFLIDWMTQNSVMPVTTFRSYNGLTEKSTSVDPYIESGVVYLHKIEALDDSQKAAAQTARDNATAEATRAVRDMRLAETDWMANSDVTMTDAWKTYRQALRDVPANNSSVTDPSQVKWPTKPT